MDIPPGSRQAHGVLAARNQTDGRLQEVQAQTSISIPQLAGAGLHLGAGNDSATSLHSLGSQADRHLGDWWGLSLLSLLSRQAAAGAAAARTLPARRWM